MTCRTTRFSVRSLLALFSLFVLCSLCVSPALAQTGGGFSGPSSAYAAGGFQGPGPNIVTVEQVKTLPDDAKVAVQGHIVQHLGGKDYSFQDASGSMTVKISQKEWAGQIVTPQDTVQIYGEVDRELTCFKLDADQVMKQ